MAAARGSETDGRASGRDRPRDIETEIEAIRARLDGTVRELQRRLGHADIPAGARAFLDELAPDSGRRLLAAVQRNPVPAVLIGLGIAWLVVDVVRHRRGRGNLDDGHADWTAEQETETALLLADLAAASREGTRALRQAGMALTDADPAHRTLRSAAEELGRTAALLHGELHRAGWGGAEASVPARMPVAEWERLEALTSDGAREAMLAAAVQALEATATRFRMALRRALPDRLHDIVGARLAAIESLAEESAAERRTEAVT